MKFISGILFLCFLVVCVLFAVSNRQAVSIDLWPLDYVISMPLYIMTLGAFLAGLAVGGAWFWFSSLRHRLAKHSLSRQVDKLKTQLSEEKNKPLSS